MCMPTERQHRARHCLYVVWNSMPLLSHVLLLYVRVNVIPKTRNRLKYTMIYALDSFHRQKYCVCDACVCVCVCNVQLKASTRTRLFSCYPIFHFSFVHFGRTQFRQFWNACSSVGLPACVCVCLCVCASACNVRPCALHCVQQDFLKYY